MIHLAEDICTMTESKRRAGALVSGLRVTGRAEAPNLKAVTASGSFSE